MTCNNFYCKSNFLKRKRIITGLYIFFFNEQMSIVLEIIQETQSISCYFFGGGTNPLLKVKSSGVVLII